MPVDFNVKIGEGWKAKKNGRIGAVTTMEFYDTKTGEALGVKSFAPTLDHLNRMAMVIKLTKDVDMINKQLIAQYEEADNINKLKGKVQCL